LTSLLTAASRTFGSSVCSLPSGVMKSLPPYRVRRTAAPARVKRRGLWYGPLLAAEGRKGLGFLDGRPVVVINNRARLADTQLELPLLAHLGQATTAKRGPTPTAARRLRGARLALDSPLEADGFELVDPDFRKTYLLYRFRADNWPVATAGFDDR